MEHAPRPSRLKTGAILPVGRFTSPLMLGALELASRLARSLCWSVAQLVVRQTVNLEDVGSKPTWPTIQGRMEKKLWVAIIEQAIKDAEHIFWGADRERRKLGFANIKRTYRLQELEYEITSDWFINICDLADVHESHVYRAIRSLRKRYRYDECTFGSFLTRRDKEKLGICTKKRGGKRFRPGRKYRELPLDVERAKK